MLSLLIIQRVGPVIETHAFPCAQGLEIEWSLTDTEIKIDRALISKAAHCSYVAMHARAGRQDLPMRFSEGSGLRPGGEVDFYEDLQIRFTEEFGSRPGGTFVMSGVYIRQPLTPSPVVITLTVSHKWNWLWVSRSKLFELEL